MESFDSLSDEKLMILASEGRETAFPVLVSRHQNSLLNFFRRMGVSTGDAEDMTQDTFVKLFKYRARYKPRAKFTTFLYYVARRIYVDYVRRQNRLKTGISGYIEHKEINASVGGVSGDMYARAVEALHELSEEMRSVIVLNIYQGLKYQEIADALEIPLGTVKTRMFYALRKLKEVMKNDGSK
jgi:RNA polymerase sigma-70 factor (ECF subfamily)